eukprot:919825-Rhodomonas_salina.1
MTVMLELPVPARFATRTDDSDRMSDESASVAVPILCPAVIEIALDLDTSALRILITELWDIHLLASHEVDPNLVLALDSIPPNP